MGLRRHLWVRTRRWGCSSPKEVVSAPQSLQGISKTRGNLVPKSIPKSRRGHPVRPSGEGVVGRERPSGPGAEALLTDLFWG